jgi:predicted outer membrane repeat protein
MVARSLIPDSVRVTGLRRRMLGVVALAVGVLLLATAGAAQAGKNTVLTVCQSGRCQYSSIQDAINAAPDTGTTTIKIAASTTAYAGGLDTGGKNLALVGAGAAQTTISGGGRVIGIESGTVTITGVRITGGYDTRGNGGGIANGGTLTLKSVTVSGNTTDYESLDDDSDGGGIVNWGTLTLVNTTVSGNTATGYSGGEGGGIYNFGTAKLTASRVSGNTAAGGGGGIYNDDSATLSLNSTVVTGNTAEVAGGIYNASGGTVTLTTSSVTNNTASAYGGGGIVNDGTLTLKSATVSGNTAAGGGGGILNGGTLTLTTSSVTNNTANGEGGGIYNYGTVALNNTTISGNQPDDTYGI